jgi:hypothetical protein
MDRIRAYQMLLKVRPPYQQLHTPFESPHMRRIQYNVRELELHYRDLWGVYLSQPDREDTGSTPHKKRGGYEATDGSIGFEVLEI